MNNKVENVCVSAFVYRPTSAPDLKGELGIGDFSHGVIFPLGPEGLLGKTFGTQHPIHVFLDAF